LKPTEPAATVVLAQNPPSMLHLVDDLGAVREEGAGRPECMSMQRVSTR
jgi:hypothetical protein